MIRAIILGAALYLAAGVAIGFANSAELALYEGNGCPFGPSKIADPSAKLSAVETWLNRKVDYLADSLPAGGTWAGIQSDAGYTVKCWNTRRPGTRLTLAVPLLSSEAGQTWVAAASGANDAQYKAIATTLVQNGEATASLRLAWEFNGGWFASSVCKGKPLVCDPANFIKTWQRAVTVMRSVAGQQFAFVFNPTLGQQNFKPDLVWPGKSYADRVGLDFYDQDWGPHGAVVTSFAQRWHDYQIESYGLNFWTGWTTSEGVPLELDEWGPVTRTDGHGGGDVPGFVTNVVAWAAVHGVTRLSEFDFKARCCDSRISPAQGTVFPLSSAAFKAAFGK